MIRRFIALGVIAAAVAAQSDGAEASKRAYFWFGIAPDFLVKFDPAQDKEVGRIKLKHGVSFGAYLTHNKKKILVSSGKRTVIEEVDLARMEVVEEHDFKQDGFRVSIGTVREIPGGTHWYVQIRKFKVEIDRFSKAPTEWLLYNVEEQEVEKRMKELPKEIRRGARISPCGEKWHVFSGDLKIVDPKTLKVEATVELSKPRFTGTNGLSVRGTDLFNHGNPDAYRLVYTMRDPVKTSRTTFGLVDICLKENKVTKVTEWGWNPPVFTWRLSQDGKRAVGQTSSRGSGNLAGDPMLGLVAWDMETGKKLAEKRVPSRNGLRFAAVSPDGRKAYLRGRGHELVVFDENFEYLKTIEMAGELQHTIFVIEE
ncbi:MAG: hypothetical protein CMJ18_27030 [Phycisphaeraceae bacterium]|nr:hypothetical protein [Phycisphaeraceae bacterium]